MAESLAKSALDASFEVMFPGGRYIIHVSTDSIEVAETLSRYIGVAVGIGIAAGIGIGIGVTLGDVFASKKARPLIEAAVVEGVGGKKDNQDRPEVTRAKSLHVVLHCLTAERFLEVWADYESGRLKKRLQKEFSEVGIKVEGLKIEIENMEEVEKTKADIMKSSSEMMTEGEAETASKTDLPATDEKKLSTGNDQGFRVEISREHGNWLTIGELMYSIRKPISIYVDEIVKAFHKQLCEVDLLPAPCSSPDDCIKTTTDSDLCKSCKRWFEKLKASHENGNNPSWHENCNSAKWSEDHWEVAKFFMPALSLSPVEDAESTDLSSLLNVLECMKDDAFPGKARVNVELVEKLRSHVKNFWVHAPEQEFTDDEKKKSFSTATEFLKELEEVRHNTENTKCLKLLKRLKTSRFINCSNK